MKDNSTTRPLWAIWVLRKRMWRNSQLHSSVRALVARNQGPDIIWAHVYHGVFFFVFF